MTYDQTGRYSQIDRFNLDASIDAFRQCTLDWCIEPAAEWAESGQDAFVVMSFNCLFIDTISQFISGKDFSDVNEFMEFIRNRLPIVYSGQLETWIEHDDGTRQRSLLRRMSRDIALPAPNS